MEHLLRHLLGLFFVITALGHFSGALPLLGIQKAFGPSWVVPLVPVAQGTVYAIAGLWLLRGGRPDPVPVNADLVMPPLEVLLQFLGVWFLIDGFATLVRPMVDMFIVGELWVTRLGNFAAAAVWLVAGAILLGRPRTVVERLRRYRAA